MMKYSMMVAFGALILLAANTVGTQSQQAPPPRSDGTVENNDLLTSGFVIPFAGAESRNCPTGTAMVTLLGSRAIFTIPQIPAVPKEKAVPTDVDSILSGRGTTIFSSSILPDDSGRAFRYIGQTCTVEITIRYR
jgi:hypothetical protein